MTAVSLLRPEQGEREKDQVLLKNSWAVLVYSSGVAPPSLLWKGPALGAKDTIPAPRKQKNPAVLAFKNTLV